MAEAAGLALGVLGIAGLFSACVENFDIVVRAKKFGENFEILCTELALERARLRIWGESLGIVHDPSGRKLPFHPALFRPDIGHDIELSLTQLSNILGKADIITGRYVLQQENDDKEHSRGLTIFRDSFIKLRERIRKNQKQKSVWQVTRWSIHDEPQLERLVSKIRALLDALSSITSALEGLERQHTERAVVQPSTLQDVQHEMLVEEIESISDPESLALLEEIGSAASAPASLKVVSETASLRLSAITSSSRSYYTARTQASIPSNKKNGPASSLGRPIRPQTNPTKAPTYIEQPGASKNPMQLPVTKGEETETSIEDDINEIPQHQRWIAAITSRTLSGGQALKFTPKDMHYGRVLEPVKVHDDQVCASNARLVLQAHNDAPLARRMFHELRNLRRTEIPYVSAVPIGDSLDRILASVEGPPGTPYEDGIFWITIKLSEGQPPRLRFQTRVYHPNIDSTGKLCADYATWWEQANRMNQNQGSMQWYSRNATNHYSLGSLLVAICSLLASPNVDDPLVPEIAEIFLTDYPTYYEAAASYTTRYAQNGRPTEDELIFPSEEDELHNTTEITIDHVSKHRSVTMQGLRVKSIWSTNTELAHTSREQRVSLRDEANPRKTEMDKNLATSASTYENLSIGWKSGHSLPGIDDLDQGPLLKAVQREDMKVVEPLLAECADFEPIRSNRGERVSLAAESERRHVIQLLPAKGVNIENKDTKNGLTPLLMAARSGQRDVVELLLAKGAYIEHKDTEYGATPLSLAAESGQRDVVELLLDKGADIEHKDTKYGATPLFLAVVLGHRGVIEVLLARGADIEHRITKYGVTPLLLAARSGHRDVVELLLAKGADIEHKDTEYSRTPLSLATQFGHRDVVELLLATSQHLVWR